MGWAFAALIYVAAGGVIASLQHEPGLSRWDYVIHMVTWPVLYVVAIWLGFRDQRGGQ